MKTLVCTLAVVAAFHGAAYGAPNAKPNIVLIMADDMGYECVAANGGTSYKTPNLDKLAAGGVRFEFAYAQPLCTPSRVQLMTGLYNQRNYIRFGLLDPKAVTFSQLLKQAGYATCIVGKWQLSGGFEGPGHFGFDEYCLWQLTIRKSRYPNPVIEQNGKVMEYVNGEYGEDVVTDYLCGFIERNKERPFLAYYPMMLTHSPYVPTPDSPEYNPKARDEGAGSNKKFFADMVAYMDKTVGKIVAKLDALGLREDTIVLFTGDNGTGKGTVSRMGERVIIGGKGMTTDAGMHVPFIVNWPGKIPGERVSRDLVDFTDILPTLLDVAGAQLPRGLTPDGRSLLPHLLGQKSAPREWLYCWYSPDGGPTGVEFARDHQHKLYADGRFLDVQADPLEKAPLDVKSLSPNLQQVRVQLQAALDRYKGTRGVAGPAQKRKKGKQ